MKSFRKEVKSDFKRLEEKMDRRFEEARHDRENIREDLEATIKMQATHERELTVLTGRPQPEEY